MAFIELPDGSVMIGSPSSWAPPPTTTSNPTGPTLAGTTFQTGIDETLVAVDVYQQTGIDIINGFLQDITVDVSNDPMAEIVDTPLDMDGIDEAPPDVEDNVSTGDFVGPPDTLSSLSISSPSIMGSINTMSAAVKAGISEVKQVSSEIQTTVSGVTNSIRSATMATVAGINGVVAGLTNTITAPIRDVTTYINTATNTINQATKIGMSGVYSTFANAASTTTGMLNQITKGVLPNIVETSNLKVLNEVAAGPMGGQINLLQPNFIPNYLNSFTQPFTSLATQIQRTGSTLAKDYTQMQTAFNSIAPAWKNTTRNVQTVLSGAPFIAASNQALNTIQSGVSLSALNANINATVALANNVNNLVNTTTNVANNISAKFNTLASAPAEAYMLMAANAPVTSVSTAIAGEIPAELMA